MYKIEKLTVKNRCEIPVDAVVEIEVNESIVLQGNGYATIHIRKKFAKSLAKKGLQQKVFTPFPANWKGKPLIVVKNDDVAPIELRVGDELGEVWIYGE